MTGAHILFAGRTTVDALYWLDAMPREDTKVFARAFRVAPGGPACNAAITHALLGGRATLMSAVGAGPWAEMARAELDLRGIELVDLAADGYETPLTTVLVNAAAATRTIVNPPVSPVQVLPLDGGWDPAWGDAPAVALTDGFHLSETLPLLRSLRDGGTALCLDGGSWKPGTDVLAPMLTAAICSERFAMPGVAADAEKTLAWFAAQGVPFVAVTRGARPIVGLDRGQRFEIAIEAVEAVDTLGAGDVLHGAFCFYFAESGDFEGSLRRAAEVATRSCRGLGIGCWV
ncbi:PfkB family carbohydrate kinase [Occallatibacter riparius]|uniref:PfkB family carbohydrate kinase n=1 Tax=Occallatibacter riparius TaxID=1002689 RepID=A0A9J7BGP7_9BACT|nr:PfkB family carbohydrate kinase [Occallatibacter riparius]UWZ81960.1 PfkB family carbohydrate kinase [Occallatibacter riparius]